MPTTTALLLALLAGAPAARPTADAETTAPPKLPSLVGAESLHGGSSALAWAGFSSLGISYGQGVSVLDDLGASADLDWASTELVLSAFWRRPIATSGAWTIGARFQLGWYLDLGGTWIRADNLSDRGLLLGPSAVFSRPAGDGLVSLTASVPLTFTRRRGGGYMVAPKLSAAYETPLYGDVTLGVSTGLRWRGGGGGAPVVSGHVDAELLVLLGYRLL
jgi:hypothetical protein